MARSKALLFPNLNVTGTLAVPHRKSERSNMPQLAQTIDTRRYCLDQRKLVELLARLFPDYHCAVEVRLPAALV
jgi:hypothetical protein